MTVECEEADLKRGPLNERLVVFSSFKVSPFDLLCSFCSSSSIIADDSITTYNELHVNPHNRYGRKQK